MLDSYWLKTHNEVVGYSEKDDRPVEKEKRYIIYNPDDTVIKSGIKKIISDIEFLNRLNGCKHYEIEIKNPKHFCWALIRDKLTQSTD